MGPGGQESSASCGVGEALAGAGFLGRPGVLLGQVKFNITCYHCPPKLTVPAHWSGVVFGKGKLILPQGLCAPCALGQLLPCSVSAVGAAWTIGTFSFRPVTSSHVWKRAPTPSQPHKLCLFGGV